jgi:hypothetical protein
MAFHHPAGESRQTPIPDSWKYCVETMFLEEVKGFSNTGWRLQHRTVATFRDPRSPQLHRWADLSDVGRRDKAGFCPDRYAMPTVPRCTVEKVCTTRYGVEH